MPTQFPPCENEVMYHHHVGVWILVLQIIDLLFPNVLDAIQPSNWC